MRRSILVFPLFVGLAGCPVLLSNQFVVNDDASANHDASTGSAGDARDTADGSDDGAVVLGDGSVVEPTDAMASCDGGLVGCANFCVDPQSNPKNCSACGRQCNTTTGTASCTTATCSYACSAGRADCNAGVAPNLDGCECATSTCCGSSCQTAHSNGVGQSFYDCVSPSTYNQTQAQEACQALGPGQQCYAQDCSAATDGGTSQVVCSDTVPATSQAACVCWAYTGALAGRVHAAQSSACVCPGPSDPIWDPPCQGANCSCSSSSCPSCGALESKCCKNSTTCGCAYLGLLCN